MINRSQLNFFSPEDLIVFYLGFYNQEYGNKKGGYILSKIQSSKKVQEFITKLRIEKLSPGDDGFINVVNSIPYFFFSKGEVLGYGALFAIQQYLGLTSNDSFQLNYNSIHRIVVETIFRAKRVKVNLLGDITFFNKYFNFLEDILNKSFDKLAQENILNK